MQCWNAYDSMHVQFSKNHVSNNWNWVQNHISPFGRRNDGVQHTYILAVWWSTHAQVHVTNRALQSPVKECPWALHSSLGIPTKTYCWLGMPFESDLPFWDPLGFGDLLKQEVGLPLGQPTVQCDNHSTTIFLALHFYHIFNFIFKYVKHSTFPKQSLRESNISLFVTCLKTSVS